MKEKNSLLLWLRESSAVEAVHKFHNSGAKYFYFFIRITNRYSRNWCYSNRMQACVVASSSHPPLICSDRSIIHPHVRPVRGWGGRANWRLSDTFVDVIWMRESSVSRRKVVYHYEIFGLFFWFSLNVEWTLIAITFIQWANVKRRILKSKNIFLI